MKNHTPLDLSIWWREWELGLDRGAYWTFLNIGPLMIGWRNNRTWKRQ